MSTVMRPSGPLPPRVYWVRRLLFLAIVVLITALAWWLVSGPGDASEATSADDASRTTPTSPSATTVATTDAEPPSGPTNDPPVTGPHSQQTDMTSTLPPTTDSLPTTDSASTVGSAPTAEPSVTASTPKPPKPTKAPLAEPTGACSPTGVDMTIDVADVEAGRSNTATFELTSLDTPACTLSITPNVLVVKVTSGSDTVWSSDDCPDALFAQQVVVRTDPATDYEFTWDGNRYSAGCQPVDGKVAPGGYWIEAALIGGEPHKAYFDITRR